MTNFTIDKRPFEPRDWPTREQWASDRHNPYRLIDQESSAPAPWQDKVSSQASDYCDGGLAEVKAIVVMLQRFHRELGRELHTKNAEARSRSLFQQKGESGGAWYCRQRAMPREDQELLQRCTHLVWERQFLAGYGKLLTENQIPDSLPRGNVLPSTPEAKAAIEAIRARHMAAYAAARDAWEAETRQKLIANVPIDDAAWAKELEWRRQRDEQRRADWDRL